MTTGRRPVIAPGAVLGRVVLGRVARGLAATGSVAVAAFVTASCDPVRCASDADCPSSAPICFLSECSATEPPYYGQLNQPCTYSNLCDEELRCVEDDGDAATRPNCRTPCTLAADAPPCPSGFECLEAPSTPGEGACVPETL